MQANLLAATASSPEALGQVYNIAVGDWTTLAELFAIIRVLRPVFEEHGKPEDVAKRFLSRVADLLGGDFGR